MTEGTLGMVLSVLESTPRRWIQLAKRYRLTSFDKKAKHQELGTVSLGELINDWAGHDLMHTVQGERAMMQIYIDGCGPWKKYFSDHVAG